MEERILSIGRVKLHMLRLLTHKHLRVPPGLSSGSLILLIITLELRVILQNIHRKVVNIIMINISPPDIFSYMLLLERFNQNFQTGFGHREH